MKINVLLRLHPSLLSRLDHAIPLAIEARPDWAAGGTLSRSGLIRYLLIEGLDRLAAEEQKRTAQAVLA